MSAQKKAVLELWEDKSVVFIAGNCFNAVPSMQYLFPFESRSSVVRAESPTTPWEGLMPGTAVKYRLSLLTVQIFPLLPCYH